MIGYKNLKVHAAGTVIWVTEERQVGNLECTASVTDPLTKEQALELGELLVKAAQS
jgi:hypothetical protein